MLGTYNITKYLSVVEPDPYSSWLYVSMREKKVDKIVMPTIYGLINWNNQVSLSLISMPNLSISLLLNLSDMYETFASNLMYLW